MKGRDPRRLREYLQLITRKRGGPEEVLATISAARSNEAPGGSGFEVLDGPPVVEMAQKGLEAVVRDQEPSPEEYDGMEAIIFSDLRPAIDVIDGRFTVTHPLWHHLSTDAEVRQRVEAVMPSIGRIELPGHPRIPFGGTGFVVGESLVMTNRHVAALFASGIGDRTLEFLPEGRAAIDFLRERGSPKGTVLQVRRVAMIHPYWDMAILEVEGLTPDRLPISLALTDARELQPGHDIFVVGYPAFDPRNPTDIQHDVMRGEYGIKRLQPGELHGRIRTGSFGKTVMAAAHDCSTLGGNSGSAVVDLTTGEVLALHFGGRYQERNYCVPASELGRDGRVIDLGVRFAGTPVRGATEWDEWWRRADEAEAPMVSLGPRTAPEASRTSATVNATADFADSSTGASEPGRNSAVSGTLQGAAVTVEVPLRVTISLGAVTLSVPDARPADQLVWAAENQGRVVLEATEALVEPFHEANYDSRQGYDPGFLHPSARDPASPWHVPMPKARDETALARTKTGETMLRYQNFSIMMHAQRRLALLCASNVTGEPALRRPEPSRSYTRQALSGLGKKDRERWFLDPRLDERFQIPDIFFTRDRKAFDKGHLVRRDDVAWGRTYNELRRANGDTYHVTNCSPQVAGYNQSSRGEDNWGDLENHVLSEAASERLCLFAGPVLDPTDEVFIGTSGDGVILRAKIPCRFWKVVVARVEDGLAAFGFVLEQDLSGVVWEEFTASPEFVPTMYPLSDIAEMASLIFDDRVSNSDQFDTSRGGEVGVLVGRRRRRETSAEGVVSVVAA